MTPETAAKPLSVACDAELHEVCEVETCDCMCHDQIPMWKWANEAE